MDSDRLATYRERAEAIALPDTLDIERVTRAPDGSLGQTETTATAASGVACRVLEMGEGRSDREGEFAGMMRAEGTHMVRVPIDTDIRQADVLVWGGHRLEVSKVMHRSLATLLSVMCTEVV